MKQSGSLERPAILLIATMAGLRERLADYQLIGLDEAAGLDEGSRRTIHVAVLSSLSPFGANDMDRFPKLKLLVTVGSGAEKIDAAAASARGIRIVTGAGANAEDVADVAAMLFVGAARGMVAADARVRQGDWRPGEMRPVRSLGAFKVGIMGMGAIGQAISRRLQPFRCELAWTGPNPKPGVALPYFPRLADLASWADALIVAAPLNGATAGAVDRGVIEALGPEGVIVNVGRGGIIDEDELIAALKEGRLGGAGLDVFAEEPTPAERWQSVPNVFLSPHTGAVTFQSLAAVVTQVADNVAAFFR